mmetsp:Transcript_10409/g.11892  ORF Transcript_10409/g.11892 Transcript_10409/m.11892 type:complete len:91 (+) Transcript_10409:2-274(+)
MTMIDSIRFDSIQERGKARKTLARILAWRGVVGQSWNSWVAAPGVFDEEGRSIFIMIIIMKREYTDCYFVVQEVIFACVLYSPRKHPIIL